jgi:hypothetical protein
VPIITTIAGPVSQPATMVRFMPTTTPDTDQRSVFDLARGFWPEKFDRPSFTPDQLDAMTPDERAAIALEPSATVTQADVDALSDDERARYYAAVRRLA